jgi:hypothetical protein
MENIENGGAALTAHKLQYVDMTTKEREEITQGLLKYYELDTLAMVMIYEHFKHDINNQKGNDMKYLFLLFFCH